MGFNKTLDTLEMTVQFAEKLVQEIDTPFEFIMTMGTIFDFWTDKKGYTIQEAKDLMNLLKDAHEQVNDKLGTFSGER